MREHMHSAERSLQFEMRGTSTSETPSKLSPSIPMLDDLGCTCNFEQHALDQNGRDGNFQLRNGVHVHGGDIAKDPLKHINFTENMTPQSLPPANGSRQLVFPKGDDMKMIHKFQWFCQQLPFLRTSQGRAGEADDNSQSHYETSENFHGLETSGSHVPHMSSSPYSGDNACCEEHEEEEIFDDEDLSEEDVDHWGADAEDQLEQILLDKLEGFYQDAEAKVVGFGYSKEQAHEAVSRYGNCFGEKDCVTNIVDATMSANENDVRFSSRSELQRDGLALMVHALQVTRRLNRGDAMWCLHLCDLNLGAACEMDAPSQLGSPAKSRPVPAELVAFVPVNQGALTEVRQAIPRSKGKIYRGKSSTRGSAVKTRQGDPSMTTKAAEGKVMNGTVFSSGAASLKSQEESVSRGINGAQAPKQDGAISDGLSSKFEPVAAVIASGSRMIQKENGLQVKTSNTASGKSPGVQLSWTLKPGANLEGSTRVASGVTCQPSASPDVRRTGPIFSGGNGTVKAEFGSSQLLPVQVGSPRSLPVSLPASSNGRMTGGSIPTDAHNHPQSCGVMTAPTCKSKRPQQQHNGVANSHIFPTCKLSIQAAREELAKALPMLRNLPEASAQGVMKACLEAIVGAGTTIASSHPHEVTVPHGSILPSAYASIQAAAIAAQGGEGAQLTAAQAAWLAAQAVELDEEGRREFAATPEEWATQSRFGNLKLLGSGSLTSEQVERMSLESPLHVEMVPHSQKNRSQEPQGHPSPSPSSEVRDAGSGSSLAATGQVAWEAMTAEKGNTCGTSNLRTTTENQVSSSTNICPSSELTTAQGTSSTGLEEAPFPASQGQAPFEYQDPVTTQLNGVGVATGSNIRTSQRQQWVGDAMEPSLPSSAAHEVALRHCEQLEVRVGELSAQVDRKREERMQWLEVQIDRVQAQLEERKDWAQQRVMQAARRLLKDSTELKTLRLEREEAQRLKKEKQALEDSTMKKLAEMEGALRKASGQVDRANAAARRLEAENAETRAEMQAANLRAIESASKLAESAKREAKAQKKAVTGERQKAKLQEELTEEKRKHAAALQQCALAKERQQQAEVRWRQEEKARAEAVERAEGERRAREHSEAAARRREEGLRSKADADARRHREDVARLEREIAQLRVAAEASLWGGRGGLSGEPGSDVGMGMAGNGFSGEHQALVAMLGAPGLREQNTRLLRELHEMQQQMGAYEAGAGFGGASREIRRERECVMCMTEEVAIVFLPCAHQVLCGGCSELHEQQGMVDCPSCRTLIQQRICVFGPA